MCHTLKQPLLLLFRLLLIPLFSLGQSMMHPIASDDIRNSERGIDDLRVTLHLYDSTNGTGVHGGPFTPLLIDLPGGMWEVLPLGSQQPHVIFFDNDWAEFHGSAGSFPFLHPMYCRLTSPLLPEPGSISYVAFNWKDAPTFILIPVDGEAWGLGVHEHEDNLYHDYSVSSAFRIVDTIDFPSIMVAGLNTPTTSVVTVEYVGGVSQENEEHEFVGDSSVFVAWNSISSSIKEYYVLLNHSLPFVARLEIKIPNYKPSFLDVQGRSDFYRFHRSVFAPSLGPCAPNSASSLHWKNSEIYQIPVSFLRQGAAEKLIEKSVPIGNLFCAIEENDDHIFDCADIIANGVQR